MVTVGELSAIWEKGLRDNHLCGCGEPFAKCEFWERVGDLAFGGWDNVDHDHRIALRRSVDRGRYLPFAVARGFHPAIADVHANSPTTWNASIMRSRSSREPQSL